MYLYDIAAEYRTLFDQLEEMQENAATEEERIYLETAWFDTLESIEAEFDDKAENVIAYIKELKAQAAALKEQEKAFAERRRAKEHHAERLKKYLLDCMNATNRVKIDRPMGCATVRNNAESPRFADEEKFIMWAKNNAAELLRYKDPEIDKVAVKRCLQAGHEIVGVTLERSQSVVIK